MANNTLRLLASKLGLQEEDKLLNKAAELQRLLQTRGSATSNLTDTSKVVICLDLAADLLGVDLDIKSAIKYSGLKHLAYKNSKKVVGNILEVNCDRLTTSLLATTMQCSQVQELADKILKEYQRQSKMGIDLDLPQYVCMAVYHACRLNKVKIAKSKIIEKSRLRPAQWTKLDSDWTKFVDLHFSADKKKNNRQPKTVENVETEDKMEIEVTKHEESLQDIIEPYEVWKKRMLEAAYAELKEEEKNNRQSITPRKSPRKSVQKLSPYKTPIKNDVSAKGVRLLFPKDL